MQSPSGYKSILAIRLVHAIVPTRKGIFDSVHFPRDIPCDDLPYNQLSDGRHDFGVVLWVSAKNFPRSAKSNSRRDGHQADQAEVSMKAMMKAHCATPLCRFACRQGLKVNQAVLRRRGPATALARI